MVVTIVSSSSSSRGGERRLGLETRVACQHVNVSTPDYLQSHPRALYIGRYPARLRRATSRFHRLVRVQCHTYRARTATISFSRAGRGRSPWGSQADTLRRRTDPGGNAAAFPLVVIVDTTSTLGLWPSSIHDPREPATAFPRLTTPSPSPRP